MEALNALVLCRQAGEELKIEEELWEKSENEVHSFLKEWLKELIISDDTKVRKVLEFSEPMEIFTSWQIAKMILIGRGFKVVLHENETRGFLWLCKPRPAYWEIVPAKFIGR